MTRDDFMDFFRDDEKLNTLSVYDRVEVFRTILAGRSDITSNLLIDTLRSYGINVGAEYRFGQHSESITLIIKL